ncbi:MAG TPA: bifunctional UDP-N-acetylglucosamine diphosphorylase/glucosamine-1-phosphate N-acetyltransferase GlmU [Candidatus Polarisedimenticolia bacterium]|nr:bifunctional UDP-N-acetylglucosamine diphosphorylase/glucosamine-1-phosphate N-acetyltransferase GlmU [Candidatus Polarisedimenticolia bacterium]
MATRKRDLCTLILAAGQGKRMVSRASKLVHDVAGRPMVRHVVEAAKAAGMSRCVVVVGNQADEVRGAVGDGDKRIAFAYQKDQLGTGHAVLSAERQIAGHRGDILILNGDLPALRAETLRRFVEFHRAAGAPLSLLTTVVLEPRGYGRVIRNYSGDVSRIVEESDASPEERATQEINCGIYCVDADHLCRPLKRATSNNAQGEIYLTDLVEILRRDGRKVAAYRHPEPSEVLGVNDRRDLAAAARALYQRKAEAMMADGVTIQDPPTTYIDADVTIGPDSYLEPGVMLLGRTEIGREVRVGAGSRVADSKVGDGTAILPYCVITSSRIGRACRIGPFAHLRPETVLDEDVRLGNFVETKKAKLGRGSKANHLAYLGDTDVGREANIGAGTITCNFDGATKHRTVIEDEVFIGSDTQLVAPVRVRKGAFVGAGSTITKDVPAYALAISRGRQVVKEDWARRFGPQARQKGDPGPGTGNPRKK